MGSGQGANRQASLRATQYIGRSGGEIDANRIGLPGIAGGQHQEGHPLPQSKESFGTRGYGAPDQRDGQILRLACKRRGLEQSHGRGLDGDDQVARKRKENRAPGCLWARQHRNGLPRRRDLRYREERALPAPEEHLRCETVIAGVRPIENAKRGRWRPRVALLLLCTLSLPVVAQPAAAGPLRVVATTSDLASLAQAVTGDLAQVESIIPAAADPEAFEPRPSDLARSEEHTSELQ